MCAVCLGVAVKATLSLQACSLHLSKVFKLRSAKACIVHSRAFPGPNLLLHSF